LHVTAKGAEFAETFGNKWNKNFALSVRR